MQIEKTDSEIVIKVSSKTNLVGLQKILDYVKFQEIISKSEATEKQIGNLAEISKSSWWQENKRRFLK